MLTHRFGLIDQKVGEAQKAGNTAAENAWSMLAVLYHPTMEGRSENGPYGAVNGNIDGSRSVLPQDISTESLDALSILDVDGADPEFRARLADAKWIVSRDALSAKLAAGHFFEIGLHLLRRGDHVGAVCGQHRLERAVTLALRVDKRGDLPNQFRETLHSEIETRMEGLKQESDLTAVSAMIDALLELGDSRLEDIARWCSDAARHAESIREFAFAKNFSTKYGDVVSRISPDRAKQAALESAEIAVREAEMFRQEGADGWLVANRLESAIELFRKVGGQQERIAALQRELQGEQQRIPETMEVVSVRVPEADVTALSNEANRTFDEFEENKLRGLGGLDFAPSLEELRQSSGSRLIDLVRSSRINDRGHNVREFKGGDEDKFGRMVRNWTHYASFRGTFVEFIRERLIAASAELDDWIEGVLAESNACPPNHEKQLSRGIRAAIDGDAIVALHILPVQLEGIIRHVLEQRGMQVFRLENDLTQQARTLNSILETPEVAGVFSEHMAFTLRFALSERGAWNLRNEVSHALMADEEFSQGVANYLLWLTLRLLTVAGHGAGNEADEQSTEDFEVSDE
jgi:hypothetical protein